MNCYFILNAFAGNPLPQCRELWRFYRDFSQGCPLERIIVLCPRDTDTDAVCGGLPDAKVLFVYADRYEPESMLSMLERQADLQGIYLFGNDFSADELAVRLAYRLNGSSLTGLESLSPEKGVLVGRKSVYSGNMRAAFRIPRLPCCVSTAKGAATPEMPAAAEHTVEKVYADLFPSGFVLRYDREGPRKGAEPENAQLLIALGKGIGSGREMEDAKELATLLGAEIVASRPLVMQGLAPLDRLAGVSGLIASPGLCIAAGVSGAPAFFAGIEKSGQIISVNTDPDAPVMKQADAVILGDYREVFAALKEYLEQHHTQDRTEAEKA